MEEEADMISMESRSFPSKTEGEEDDPISMESK